MEHLTLVALSEDRARLLLVDRHGVQYTLDVDNSLRSALRGEQPRPGHLETRMDSALRPRDIQARIRAGETAEAVAAAAGSTVAKIMPFAAPVLAERAHVAQRAQKSSVRRLSADSNQGSRTLEEAVQTQLRAKNIDPDIVEWDAWRREDGRWTLTGLYETAERTGAATFIFDLPGNYVTLEDDDARWIVGDLVTETPRGFADAEFRRLSSVPGDLGDDAIQLVTPASEATTDDAPAASTPGAPTPSGLREAGVGAQTQSAPDPTGAAPAAPVAATPVPLGEERTVDLTETVNNIRSAITRVGAPAPAHSPQPAAPAPASPVVSSPATSSTTPSQAVPTSTAPAAPVPPAAGAAPTTDSQTVEAGDEHASPEGPAAESPVEPAPENTPPPKKSAKRRGRASVPSWDEIMFGGGGSE